MVLESTNGKKEDFKERAPKIPKMTNAAITTLTATWCLIK
jgi:hypothetical protein